MDQELLYKYIRVETTPEEDRAILEWLDADPEKHNKELNAIRYVCMACDFLADSPAEASKSRRVVPLRKIMTYVAGAAAVLTLILGANYLGQRTTLSDVSKRMATMEIPDGQRIRLELEDGSAVWLNSGTKLEYPAVFGRGERRVRLSGEAMFEVRHEKSRPFVVETFASEVEVLGTKFNVIADEASRRFSTALISGKVKVSDLVSRQTLYMAPNEVVKLVNGRLVKDVIDDPVALQWTEGLLSIKGLTFPELMDKFEKAYGVKINVDCKIMPMIEIRSGKLRVSDGIDHALRVLQLTSDFTYTKNDETNEITIQ